MESSGRKSNYDRARLLGQAMCAAQRRRHKRAIAVYRKILAVDPNDTQILRKIAPLLARTRQPEEAPRPLVTVLRRRPDTNP